MKTNSMIAELASGVLPEHTCDYDSLAHGDYHRRWLLVCRFPDPQAGPDGTFVCRDCGWAVFCPEAWGKDRR